MKRLYISILLASFQIFYYLGWVSYSNKSYIPIMDLEKELEYGTILVTYRDVPAFESTTFVEANQDSIILNELQPVVFRTINLTN